VTELESSGYAVVPALGELASAGDAGLATIESDLQAAVASIHLLGELDAVDEHGASRVRFALAQAAGRANASGGSFRRIIFAPKNFSDSEGRAMARDPIAVRDRFAEPTRYDSIVGESTTDFIVAVRDLIRTAERAQPVAAPQTLASGSLVFLNFHPSDAQYARAVSKAFRERGLRARFAAFEDDKVQNKLTNAALVRESDAVVHCWASATDAWLYAEAADYEDYRKFGRTQPFRTRAAIAGPPERGSKALYSGDDPPEAIDVYLDLTAHPLPTPSDLDPIVATVDAARQA
jgi:hypothetical protein